MSKILYRTGIGVDIHKFSTDPQRELWVAGLKWDDGPGLEGHSDGDVVCHAAADALLSAAGLGDLGSVFGVDRPEMAGASGLTILQEAARMVLEEGFEIGNIAVQLIGNRPRFDGRRNEAEVALTEAIDYPVSVAATSSDGLGFTGAGEGLAAMATALVYVP